jgi:ATP-dependent Clp protease ATP-binding subunit ClpA
VSLFDRFTDRARKVMALSQEEAKRFNHEYIGTEHLLLGLVKEGKGVASNALKNLDIDLRKVRLEVEKRIRSGPDMVASSVLTQTPRAKKVIEYAIEEARNLNHNYVGTEHLLLGLIRDPEGISGEVFMYLGLNIERARGAVIAILTGYSLTDTASSTKEMPLEDRLSTIPIEVRDRIKKGLESRAKMTGMTEHYHSLLDEAIDLTNTCGLSIVAAFAEVYEKSRNSR